MSNLLENKVAIVTGGTRGIGLATVKAFLDEGAKVILCGSKKESVDKALNELNNENVRGIWPKLDDFNDVKENFDKAISEFGKIDILVNNAGISESTPFDKYSEELFDKVLDLNVKGVFNCCKAVVDKMVEQKSGVILNTSSMVSITGQPGGVAYPTSKFAVNGFTLSLARELGPKGIRVNAVAPGIAYTDMMRAVPKEVIEPLIARIPLKRLGQPEDIANAFVFLASEKASYITGVVLSVDGLART